MTFCCNYVFLVGMRNNANRWISIAALTAAAAVFASACGDDTDTTGTTTTTTTTGASSTTTTGSTGGGGEGGAGEGGAGQGGGQGGGGGGSADVTAEAVLEPKSGSQAKGTAVFSMAPDGKVTLTVDVQNVTPPGKHGIHIHENGDCSHAMGDSAGGHWNPYGKPHGAFGMGDFHLGDIGNIDIKADGTGTLTMSTDLWKVNDKSMDDVVGLAVILHEGEDNLTPNPNPGGRIGCGVIVAK